MTGPEHYRLAEELAQEARNHLSQGNNQGAMACATLAQVHATLTLVVATDAASASQAGAQSRSASNAAPRLADPQATFRRKGGVPSLPEC